MPFVAKSDGLARFGYHRPVMNTAIDPEGLLGAEVQIVAGLLRARSKTVATAESCTGGLLAKLLTDVPGSSAYFLEGVVAYANAAKQRLLGVPQAVIEQHGAVSQEVAAAMALGCRVRSRADFALSVTGIAGPSGGSPGKPVGLVYVGIAATAVCEMLELRLDPQLGRAGIRARAALAALQGLHVLLEKT